MSPRYAEERNFDSSEKPLTLTLTMSITHLPAGEYNI